MLDVGTGFVPGVSSVVNPDELGHPGPVADLGSLLASRDPGSIG
jgi:hypothetical protein